MSLLVYCYGPLSVKKNLFCKQFVKENTEYKLIELHKIRKKTIGSYTPIDKNSEQEVKKEFEKTCLALLKKKTNLLINGLLLNQEARVFLNNSIKSLTKNNLKIVSVGFPVKNLTDLFEENQKTIIYKNITFDQLRSQAALFSLACEKKEADLLINEIDDSSESSYLELDTKLWEENRIIHCNNFKKVGEYFLYGNSFNN
jgi:hypothetical protein